MIVFGAYTLRCWPAGMRFNADLRWADSGEQDGQRRWSIVAPGPPRAHREIHRPQHVCSERDLPEQKAFHRPSPYDRLVRF